MALDEVIRAERHPASATVPIGCLRVVDRAAAAMSFANLLLDTSGDRVLMHGWRLRVVLHCAILRRARRCSR